MENCSTKDCQQYRLKWTNFTNNIMVMFEEQLKNEYFVDVTLSCEGQLIKAHRMVLSACSTYFKELLQTYNSTCPLIIFNGVKFSDLEQIIEYIYHGEVKVFDTDLERFLKVAENLGVKGLCNVRTQPEEQVEEKEEDLCTNKKRKLSMTENDSKTSIPIMADDVVLSNERSQILSFLGGSSNTNIVDLKEKCRKVNQTRTKKSLEVNDNSPEETQSKFASRPPNAFMIFAKEWRQRLERDHPGESNKKISVRLGSLWKSLSSFEKESYYSESRKREEEYRLNFTRTKNAGQQDNAFGTNTVPEVINVEEDIIKTTVH